MIEYRGKKNPREGFINNKKKTNKQKGTAWYSRKTRALELKDFCSNSGSFRSSCMTLHSLSISCAFLQTNLTGLL